MGAENVPVRKKSRQPAMALTVAQSPSKAASAAALQPKPKPKPAPALDLDELRMARLPVAEPQQLLAAAQVLYGEYACDGDRSLRVTESSHHTGYVEVITGHGRWTMKPVQSTSGALRLEDVRQVTLLVQISTKSMLLDTESGRRLLDNCISAPQRLTRQDDSQTLGLAR